MSPSKKAVVLLSGGIDSATVAAIAISEGFEVHALTVDYGQRNTWEIEAARSIAAALELEEHLVFELEIERIAGCALTGEAEVPRGLRTTAGDGRVPVTYVPARNTVFLSLALAWAESIGATDVFIGVNAIDYSGYPDCRPEYIEAFQLVAELGTASGLEGSGIRVRAPLVDMSKADVVREGLRLGVDYALTRSCYDPGPGGKACGECESCMLRKAAFERAGVEEPGEG